MTASTSVSRSRGASIGAGVVSALAGLALLLWPGATTLVIVALLGLGILAYGVYEIVMAVTGAGEGSRLWGGIVGVVAILGGILVFATPLLTAVAVGLVIGWFWIVSGVMEAIAVFTQPGHRFVRLVVAAISLVAGVLVIAQPGLSLVALVWFSGLWLVVSGVVMVVAALFTRRSTTIATT